MRKATLLHMGRDSDGDVSSQFREDFCHCHCFLSHHTVCSPGSDTVQCFSALPLLHPPPPHTHTLSRVMHVCPLVLAFSHPCFLSLLFSLPVSVRAFSIAAGKMDGQCFGADMFSCYVFHIQLCSHLQLSLPPETNSNPFSASFACQIQLVIYCRSELYHSYVRDVSVFFFLSKDHQSVCCQNP